MIAYPISQFFAFIIYKKCPLSGAFKTILYLPSILSSMVIAMFFKYFVERALPAYLGAFGVKNVPLLLNTESTAFGTIMFYTLFFAMPGAIVINTGTMSRVPVDLIEYGKLEGIGMFRELVTVVVPLIWPMISTSLVLSCTSVFTFFIQVQLITQGAGDSATIAYVINSLVSGGSQNLEKAAAFGICCSLFAAPIIVIVKNVSERFFADVSF